MVDSLDQDCPGGALEVMLGGGTRLTLLGGAILDRYQAMQATALAAVVRQAAALIRLVGPAPES